MARLLQLVVPLLLAALVRLVAVSRELRVQRTTNAPVVHAPMVHALTTAVLVVLRLTRLWATTCCLETPLLRLVLALALALALALVHLVLRPWL